MAPRYLRLLVILLGLGLLWVVTPTWSQTPPATWVRFKTKTYSVGEKAGDAEIEIIREGDAEPEVEVTFSTSKGTATPDDDYEDKTETVKFAKDETSKTVKVKIIYKNPVEPNETVNLLLKDPKNAALKDPFEATLIILDADAPKKPVLTVEYPNALKEGETAVLKITIHHPTLNESLKVKVEWGDGISQPEEFTVTNSTGIVETTASHQYVDDNPTNTPSDENKVKVTVTDSDSDADSKEFNITIENVAPVFTELLVTLPDAANKVTVTGYFFDPSMTDTHTVEILWGDATALQTVNINGRDFTVTHEYTGGVPAEGRLIIFTLKDDDKGETTAQRRVRRVHILADVNRDGALNNSDNSETLKKDHGTVVIADKEGVYADEGLTVGGTKVIADEKARRREVKFQGTGPKMVVKRSSAKVRLFSAATGGTEQEFDGSHEAKLDKDTSYWLQGGTDPSAAVRDQSLKVKEDADGATYEAGDQLNITVLWVDLPAPRITDARTKKPWHDGSDSADAMVDQANLGVQRSGPNSTFGEKAAFGCIEIQGSILPKDFSFPGVPLTLNFSKDGDASPGKATLGFVFRRFMHAKISTNGQAPEEKKTIDDSHREYQDVNPDLKDDKLLIIDFDGPGGLISGFFGTYVQQQRRNFWQHVVFHFGDPAKPERASKRIIWACTMDFMLNSNAKVIFLREAPNGGGNLNKLLNNGHVSLDIDFIKKPKVDSAETAGGDKKLKVNAITEVIVKGENLLGKIELRKMGVNTIEPLVVLAKPNAPDAMFTPLTEIKIAFFLVGATKGAGYELYITNPKGEAKVVGFEIVD